VATSPTYEADPQLRMEILRIVLGNIAPDETVDTDDVLVAADALCNWVLTGKAG
jgi:hypothetical protein